MIIIIMVHTYMRWLFDQRKRNDPIGDLAKDAFADPSWDGRITSLRALIRSDGSDGAKETFFKSIIEYREQKKPY